MRLSEYLQSRLPEWRLSVTNMRSMATDHLGAVAVIALGSNVAGDWGTTFKSIRHAVRAVLHHANGPVRVASLYESRPEGQVRQPEYLNTVLTMSTALSPFALLLIGKRLERLAGRRLGARNSARPLDIDIVDYGGRVINWPVTSGPRPQLILPHPLAHRRGFVLQPLDEIAPEWRHPVLQLRPGALLRRNPEYLRGLRVRLDSNWYSCDIPL